MSRRQDRRQAYPEPDEFLLKVQAIGAGQADIENDASWSIQVCALRNSWVEWYVFAFSPTERSTLLSPSPRSPSSSTMCTTGDSPGA